MPTLTHKGALLAEFPTRAQCIVEAFERGLVQQYGRRRCFANGVKIEGIDDPTYKRTQSAGSKARTGEKAE